MIDPRTGRRRVLLIGTDDHLGYDNMTRSVPSRPERPEGLILIYDGGVVTETDVAAIRLQADELASYAFVYAERVPKLTSARCWHAGSPPAGFGRRHSPTSARNSSVTRRTALAATPSGHSSIRSAAPRRAGSTRPRPDRHRDLE